MKQNKLSASRSRRFVIHPNLDLWTGLDQIALPLILIIGLTLVGLSTANGQEASQRLQNKKNQPKEICLTFDELPAAEGFGGVDYQAVSFLIIEALQKHEVNATGFVVGSQMKGKHDILGQWLNEGHKLGSMTYSNQDYHELGIEQFLRDVRMGTESVEGMLSGFGQKKRYFRFPFLHSGLTVEGKRQATMFLESIDNISVPATVLPEDYLYNLRLTKMGKQPDSTQFEALLNEYVNHVLDELERCERVAKQVAGRRVKQILVLQANRLNAVYLDEMLGAIKAMGYKFITVDEALKDNIYSESEAYFGTRRLGWLDRILASDPDLLPAR